MRVRFYIITFYDFPRLQPVRSSVDGAKYRSFRSTSEIVFITRVTAAARHKIRYDALAWPGWLTDRTVTARVQRPEAPRLASHGRRSALPSTSPSTYRPPKRPAAPAAADSHLRRGPWSTAPVRRPSAPQKSRRAIEPNSPVWHPEQAQAR